jgi:predicted MFS family arabinose efflux permease
MVAILSVVGWVALILLFLSLMLVRKQLRPAEANAESSALSGGLFKAALAAPVTWIGVLIVCVVNWPIHCLQSLIPGYLAADKILGGAGYGPMTAGQLMLGVTVAGMVGPLVVGTLLDKVLHGNTTLAMILGFIFASAGCYALGLHWVVGSVVLTETALVFPAMGVQFVMTMLVVFVANSYAKQVTSKVYGLWNGIGLFGGVLGVYLGGRMLSKNGNYHAAILSMAIFALIGLVLALIMKMQKPLVVKSDEPAVLKEAV